MLDGMADDDWVSRVWPPEATEDGVSESTDGGEGRDCEDMTEEAAARKGILCLVCTFMPWETIIISIFCMYK